MFAASSLIKHALASSRETEKEPQAPNLAFQASLHCRSVEQQMHYIENKQHGPFFTWVHLHVAVLVMRSQDSVLLPKASWSTYNLTVREEWLGGWLGLFSFTLSTFLIFYWVSNPACKTDRSRLQLQSAVLKYPRYQKQLNCSSSLMATGNTQWHLKNHLSSLFTTERWRTDRQNVDLTAFSWDVLSPFHFLLTSTGI